MNEAEINEVQNRIGHTFSNPDLLQQAFIRRSYSQENGGGDNEVLEFIGDKVLDFIVVKLLIDRYGYFASDCSDYDAANEYDEFFSEYQEDKLTELKRLLVEKKTLSERMDVLALAKFLILGEGDKKNHVQREASIKEDLFEAIIGAVALDSNYDLDELQSTVEIMLNPDDLIGKGSGLNYVQAIQQWVAQHNEDTPLYHFKKAGYEASLYDGFGGISQRPPIGTHFVCNYHCLIKISNDLPLFRGFGKSKREARMAVCKCAYDYLEQHDLLPVIRDEIDAPSRAMAINQLEILARRGCFSIPSYEFEEHYDGNGNPIWKCTCRIAEEAVTFQATSSAKKEAKKDCAYSMLKYVLESKEG